MRGISQLRTIELSNYINAGFSQNEKFLKPRIPMIDSWHISGVLFRTDIAEVALADNLAAGGPAIVTYLLPSVLPGTSEYDPFIEAGRKLRDLKKLQFHEELRVKDFGKKLSGLRYVPKRNSGNYVCSQCEVPTTDWPSAEKSSIFCGNCNSEIRYANCDIWLPVISAGYDNHIALKDALLTLQQEQLRIPNSIFCHILYRTASEMMFICNRRIPVVVSSDTVMITAHGKVRIAPAPTARSSRQQVSTADVPAVLANYFGHLLAFVPDPSEELMSFFALPNKDTIRKLKENARSVSTEHIVIWLRYLQPLLFAAGPSRKDAYLAVQEMLVTNREHIGPTPVPRNIAPEQFARSVASSAPNVIQQRESDTSIISELPSRFRSTKSVAGGAFALLCAACFFAFSNVGTQPASKETVAPVPKTRVVASTLHSTPAKVVRNSVPGTLKEKLDNSMATVRLLVSENGVVRQVQWIYASDEQRMLYHSALSQLDFEPASNSGKPVTGWTTLQLPLR